MSLPAASPCPDDGLLAAFAEGGLQGGEREGVALHLDACSGCRRVVAALVTVLSTPRAASPVGLAPGSLLGRYVVEGVLGSGGMGVVYAGFDPQLSRRVALKLLRPPAEGSEDVPARAERLRREAQALARLAHPHVVSVYDFGTTAEGDTFLAMELVEGPTLAAWLRERRPWREVLATFLAAGEGLAAAHRAGLVHRDFKPANVLLGRDGRARVTDFGLVRSSDAGPGPAGESQGELLTHAGALLGTPAYMAPEQRAGRPADARSDQYAFCVALHEALFGQRPSAPGEVARSGEVPSHVRRALARGLSPSPEARFASMDALLAALHPPQRRSGVWLAALPLAAALAAGALSWSLAREGRQAPDSGAQAQEQVVSLRVGERKQLQVADAARVALGDPTVVEVDGVSREGLWVEGRREGRTTLLVWHPEGARSSFRLEVAAP